MKWMLFVPFLEPKRDFVSRNQLVKCGIVGMATLQSVAVTDRKSSLNPGYEHRSKIQSYHSAEFSVFFGWHGD